MASIIHPLLSLLASCSRQELAGQVRYLKAENRILRSKLPKRLELSNHERQILVRHGKRLGPRIKELISIVSYSTFRRWVRQVEDGPTQRPVPTRKPGRPRLNEDLATLIIRIRKESGWGYTKIVQTVRGLGHTVSRQTVKNILVQAGLGPEPHDHPDTWSDFLKRHAATLWQCDFACKRKWTIKGMVDLYFLVFIHVGTRRIWVSPCTSHPDSHWTAQQAEAFQLHLHENELICDLLMRDNDKKYNKEFDEVFESTGDVKRITPISPNLQAHVERVIQTLKHEVLNGFCIVSNQHLDVILSTAADWYNHRRGHTAREHLPPVRDDDPPKAVDVTLHKVVCLQELGGMLKSYRRAAA